jgi:uncharacterized protein
MTSSDPNPYASPTATAPPLSPAEEKQWSLLTHILGIFVGIPTAAIFYILYRDRGPFVRAHTATELNFQLTVLIVSLGAIAVSFSSVFISIGAASRGPELTLFFIGYFGAIGLRIVATVLGIRASLATNRGQLYTYPSFKFVK